MPEFAQVRWFFEEFVVVSMWMKRHGEWWRTGELGVPNLRLQLLWLEGFFHGPSAWFFQIEVRIFVAPGVMLGV